MNLSPKYVAAFVLGFAAILGWNAFLIVRDAKLFKAYYHQKAQQEYCAAFTYHPDCPNNK